MSEQTAMTPESPQFQVATFFSATALLIALVMGIAYLGAPGQPISFTGGQSLAVLLTAITFTFAAGVTALSYRHIADINEDNVIDAIEAAAHANRRNFVSRVAISLAVGVLLTALWLLLLYLFTRTVGRNVEAVNGWVGLLLAGAYGGLLGFAIAYWATKLSTGNIMAAVGLFMVLGLAMAVIMVEDPTWFHNSLSFMGHDSGSDMFFNITLILSGLMLLGFNQDVLTYLKILVGQRKIERRRFNILRAALLMIPVCVTCIGLFPSFTSRVSDTIHTGSASLTALLFIVLMFTVQWIIPIYPPTFITRSRVIGVVGLSGGVLNVFGRVGFTIFELFLIGMIGIWVLVFYTSTMNIILREVRSFNPALIDLRDVDLPGKR